MDNKRANDITLLNNQIIILDAWNNWKENTTANYDARIKKVEDKIKCYRKCVENIWATQT